MRPNPATDSLAFLTTPTLLTGVLWLLLLASAAVAITSWRRDPAQRTTAHGGRFVLRVVVGCMWWQQSLWKVPPDFGGLKYWMEQMVAHGAIPLQSDLVATFVIPNLGLFGTLVYAIEVVVGLSLILGLWTRWSAALGALMAANLWLGLYSAPNEWPWTYAFLLVIQSGYVIDPPGCSLGIDALRETFPSGHRRDAKAAARA